MTPAERHEALVKLRRRIWFLRERLKDVHHDREFTGTTRQEKIGYYAFAIAETRERLLELEGH